MESIFSNWLGLPAPNIILVNFPCSKRFFFRNKVQIPNLEKLEDFYFFFQKIRNETKKACDLKIELFTDC